MRGLPLFYETDTQIFVHAGVDEEAGEWWKWTSEDMFLNKYPIRTGTFYKDVISGHISTKAISGRKGFHDIYWDGQSHYFL